MSNNLYKTITQCLIIIAIGVIVGSLFNNIISELNYPDKVNTAKISNSSTTTENYLFGNSYIYPIINSVAPFINSEQQTMASSLQNNQNFTKSGTSNQQDNSHWLDSLLAILKSTLLFIFGVVGANLINRLTDRACKKNNSLWK